MNAKQLITLLFVLGWVSLLDIPNVASAKTTL
jgi:hypothetical protein